MKKILLVILALVMVSGFFILDFDRYLTLAYIQASQSQFSVWLERHPVGVPLAFFALYVAVTALSLPGAAIMTLAAGALLGFWFGVVLVSFASSVGATLAFLATRFLARAAVQKRFAERLQAINRGVERDGAFYLFTLRLVPVFPFFIINLLMALTSLRTWTFYWVSQVGMLAGTLVYVNAGTQLASISSASDILSLKLLLSFVLLGIFPWMAKAGLNWLNRQRIYRGWPRPKQYDRNLIVIGGGAAGLVTAYIAATVKAQVTLIEAHKMGGDCLNYGCVPSKALIKSAQVAHQLKHADRYGLASADVNINFKNVMARVQQIIRTIEPHDSVERYTALGVDVLPGYAKIINPWTVEITLNKERVRTLSARSIVLATGAQPIIPAIPGIENTNYVTSDTLWDRFAQLAQPPQRLVILGGGPVGTELTQAFARLGSQVFQIERGQRILAKEDEDVSQVVLKSLTDDGAQVLTEHTALRFEVEGQGTNQRQFIIVEHNQGERRIEFDELICAVGRAARLTGYGLEDLGIPTDRTIVTNDYLETLFPNIYAAGDVAGPYQFTHTAAHMAWYAAVNALFGQFKRFKVDYSVIPRVTFTDPEVASVGLNELEAKKQTIDYEVSRFDLSELDRAITDGATTGFIKVLTVPGRDKILGVTIVGAHAGELLAEFVLAMRYGLGLNKILGTIHAYPTLVEANKYSAGVWKKAHAPQRVLRWLGRYHQWRRS